MSRHPSSPPTPLASATRRFQAWRRSRTTRRIPAELWSLATDLGARFGVSRTARALRVEYYTLKKRVDAAAAPETDEAEVSPAFVEILTTARAAAPSSAPTSALSECQVEFESTTGAKMRIQVKGAASRGNPAFSTRSKTS